MEIQLLAKHIFNVIVIKRFVFDGPDGNMIQKPSTLEPHRFLQPDEKECLEKFNASKI